MLLGLVNLPGVRLVPIWICDRRFRRWKRLRPDGSFGEFYDADA
jgi:hypothetical protein